MGNTWKIFQPPLKMICREETEKPTVFNCDIKLGRLRKSNIASRIPIPPAEAPTYTRGISSLRTARPKRTAKRISEAMTQMYSPLDLQKKIDIRLRRVTVRPSARCSLCFETRARL